MAARATGALSRLPRPGVTLWWFGELPGNPYSRRVALLKIALPAIGGLLLLMVIAWPRLAPLFDRMRFSAIDLREARELRMVNPRYVGTDRSGQPFVVTAALGRQVPGRDDVMALQGAQADMKAHDGASINLSADSGVYQTQSQLLDLFGDVTIVHQSGTRFVTNSARFDAVNNAGEGHDHVEGHGPQGDVTADGFRLIDKGNIVIFTGHSQMLLRSATQSVAKAAPEAVPPPVAQAAVQVEAKARPELAAVPAKHSHSTTDNPKPHHVAKAPPHEKPAAKKTS
jgi:lipopolysaccharide export system protein LptC